jgi:membrane protein YdbS with pleckstrin-like domain
VRELPKNKISLKALTVWRQSALIVAIIFLACVISVGIGVYFLELTYWITVALAIIWAITSFMAIFVVPNFKHRFWRYEVHEHEIDLQYGLIVIKRVLIPMVRVQHVETNQGPLLRKYKLATVEISTAATKHEIPALDLEEADLLRDRISKLARVTDDDV